MRIKGIIFKFLFLANCCKEILLNSNGPAKSDNGGQKAKMGITYDQTGQSPINEHPAYVSYKGDSILYHKRDGWRVSYNQQYTSSAINGNSPQSVKIRNCANLNILYKATE